MGKRIVTINPGSTSTKVAAFDGEIELFNKVISHSEEAIGKYEHIIDQLDARYQFLEDFLQEEQLDITELDAVVGRGGLLHPLVSGTYKVNEQMMMDLISGVNGEHASNLGALMAEKLAKKLGIPAYIVDPVVVDELQEIARYSGNKHFKRSSIFHALNQKAVARKYASISDKKYEDLQLIVAHLGGGISIGAHQNGQVIDVNNALSGEGAFGPERSGTLPMGDFLQFALASRDSETTILKEIVGKGGLVSYLETNDLREVEQMICDGNQEAKNVFDAMVYQIAKQIGEAAIVLKGSIDAVILTGGLAYSKKLVAQLADYISWIGDIIVEPGEDEMVALNEGVQRVLAGEEEVKVYVGKGE